LMSTMISRLWLRVNDFNDFPCTSGVLFMVYFSISASGWCSGDDRLEVDSAHRGRPFLLFLFLPLSVFRFLFPLGQISSLVPNWFGVNLSCLFLGTQPRVSTPPPCSGPVQNGAAALLSDKADRDRLGRPLSNFFILFLNCVEITMKLLLGDHPPPVQNVQIRQPQLNAHLPCRLPGHSSRISHLPLLVHTDTLFPSRLDIITGFRLFLFRLFMFGPRLSRRDSSTYAKHTTRRDSTRLAFYVRVSQPFTSHSRSRPVSLQTLRLVTP
jgi:hypothetical protein